MKIGGTDHLTLTVTDLQRTADWYRSVLRFEEVIRYRNESIGAECAVLAHPGAARPRIGLRQYDAPSDATFDEHRIGLDHLAFDVGDEATMHAWQDHFRDLGVPFTVTRIPELSITALRDPDNIQLELCAWNPSPTESAIDESGRIKLLAETAKATHSGSSGAASTVN